MLTFRALLAHLRSESKNRGFCEVENSNLEKNKNIILFIYLTTHVTKQNANESKKQQQQQHHREILEQASAQIIGRKEYGFLMPVLFHKMF